MTPLHLRTSNQIIRKPQRKLPLNRTGTHAVTTDDPNTLNTNVPKYQDGHGISGDQCILTIMTGTLGAAVTLTLWVWFEVGGGTDKPGFWVKLGANSTQYSKSYDSKSIDGWNLPEKTIYYIQGSANVDDVWVDGDEIASRRRTNGQA